MEQGLEDINSAELFINGKKTIMVEYSTSSDDVLNFAVNKKVWVWIEKGVFLKLEKYPQIKGVLDGVATVEYGNYVFEDIPISIFEVPEDKIVDPQKSAEMEAKEDCGTFSENEPYMDSAMVCIGKNLLNNCKKSHTTMASSDVGEVSFDITGLHGSDCMVKITYGSADQIPMEEQKIHAGKFIECPIDISSMLLSIKPKSEGEIVKPEHVASAVYFYIGLQTLSSDTKCMGTLLNPNKL